MTYKTTEQKLELDDFLTILQNKVIQRSKNQKTENISGHLGTSSRLLFLTYLCKNNPIKTTELREIINTDIKKVFDHVANSQVESFYVNGLAGMGWCISHISDTIELDENELLEGLDDHLFEQSKYDIAAGNFDFFYGGFGYANYFLERAKKSEKCKTYFLSLIDLLITIRIDFNGYLVWQSIDDKEDEIIDLSLSHGMTAAAALFLSALKLGIGTDKCKLLLEETCRFLADQSVKLKGADRIADVIEKDKMRFSPLRWCHGDLGIAYVLMHSGILLRDNKLLSLGESIAKTLSEFTRENQELLSVTICHGTLGVAHLFKKIAKLSAQPARLNAAATYWYQQSLEILNSSVGFSHTENGTDFEEQEGILHGLEGIGLALVSMSDDKLDSWDRSILLS